jgi:hypothetical protein
MSKTNGKVRTHPAGWLPKAQRDILKLLSRGGKYTRKEIASKAKTDLAWLTTYLVGTEGSVKATGITSLLVQKAVRSEERPAAREGERDERVFSITKTGQRMLKKAKSLEK